MNSSTPKSDKKFKRISDGIREDSKSVIGWIISGIIFGLVFSSIMISIGCFLVAFLIYLFKDSNKRGKATKPNT